MFESLERRSVAQDIRAGIAIPLAALLLSQLYFALYPLAATVPAWLVYGVGVVLVAGGAGGTLRTTYLLFRERRELTASAWTWALATFFFSLGSLWFAAGLFLPWL